MSEIITATYNFLDSLESSKLIKDLTKYKNKLLSNQDLLSQIAELKKETDSTKIIAKRKEIYRNKDYCEYIKRYNELSFIILKINKKYHDYTNTKE